MAPMIRRVTLGVATATMAATLTACQEEATSNTGDPLSTGESTTAVTTQSLPAGRWISHLSRQRIAGQLQEAGFGRWAEAFFASEKWSRRRDRLTAVYTFTPTSTEDKDTWRGTFQVAYFEVGGFWHVGWKGPLVVRGHAFTVHDDFSDVTDRFQWHLTNGDLDVNWTGSDAKSYRGVPEPVEQAAWFSDPLQPSDCPLAPATNC